MNYHPRRIDAHSKINKSECASDEHSQQTVCGYFFTANHLNLSSNYKKMIFKSKIMRARFWRVK